VTGWSEKCPVPSLSQNRVVAFGHPGQPLVAMRSWSRSLSKSPATTPQPQALSWTALVAAWSW